MFLSCFFLTLSPPRRGPLLGTAAPNPRQRPPQSHPGAPAPARWFVTNAAEFKSCPKTSQSGGTLVQIQIHNFWSAALCAVPRRRGAAWCRFSRAKRLKSVKLRGTWAHLAWMACRTKSLTLSSEQFNLCHVFLDCSCFLFFLVLLCSSLFLFSPEKTIVIHDHTWTYHIHPKHPKKRIRRELMWAAHLWSSRIMVNSAKRSNRSDWVAASIFTSSNETITRW